MLQNSKGVFGPRKLKKIENVKKFQEIIFLMEKQNARGPKREDKKLSKYELKIINL